MSRYLPVNHKEVVDGSQDPEEGESSLSPDYDTREKQSPFVARTAHQSTWTRLIPWSLCLFLTVLNLFAWTMLSRSVTHNTIYCKYQITTHRHYSLTVYLAPANVALKYTNVRWEAAIQDDMTDFQGVPNAKNNKLWDDLFNARKSLENFNHSLAHVSIRWHHTDHNLRGKPDV